jgi:hypothetical protein
MKVEILPARRADLAAITDFLKKEWPEYIAPAAGDHVHVGNWMPDHDSYGLRLLVDGELAGFLGASYSLRSVDGVDERFCAIAPWFVKAEHRPHSLPMLLRLLADRKQSYVNLTPTRDMFRLFSSLGFAKLDEAKLLIPPFFNLPAYRPWRGRVVSAPAAIRAVLPLRELKVFEDHEATRCCHLAVVEGDRVCYLAAGRRMLRDLPFAELLHVSEPAVLAPQLERVVWTLCRRLRAVSVAADERLLAGAPARAIRYRLNAPPLFKSAHIGRERIDNMWSELVL